jgi:hypothetical protein
MTRHSTTAPDCACDWPLADSHPAQATRSAHPLHVLRLISLAVVVLEHARCKGANGVLRLYHTQTAVLLSNENYSGEWI